MTTSPRRSCRRSKGWRSAAPPSAGCARPWGGPPSIGDGPGSIGARREPRTRMGALVQLDASPFAWLEARRPAMSLHGAIDATGTVLALHVRPTEDLHGSTTGLRALATQYGLPLAFSGDRLTSELRLRHITTPAGANAFLPEFLVDLNRRFTRAPADPAPAWRVPPRDLALVLSCRYTRRVARDNTVRLGPRWIQLPPGPHHRSYAGGRVELRELLDGRLVVFREGTVLATQAAPPAFVLKPRSAPGAEIAAPHVPQAPRSPTTPRSPSPPTRGSARPAARHPWHRAITRKAQIPYPVKG